MEFSLKGFEPIIPNNAKILILGSFPGVQSLVKQEYYAHPQNQFWKILFELLKAEFSTNYTIRQKLLHENHIAIWDVIDTCQRKGSLDVDIRKEAENNIKDLLEEHSTIKALFCNGQKSYKNLIKIMGTSSEIPIYALPSTSPAHASMKKEEKLEQWKIILDFLM